MEPKDFATLGEVRQLKKTKYYTTFRIIVLLISLPGIKSSLFIKAKTLVWS